MNETATHARHMVKPGAKVHLRQVDAGDTGPYKDKYEVRPLIEDDGAALVDLQELLFAEDKHAVLVVMQAMDTGGKDGVIRNVFSQMNPQGVQVTAFKVPTVEELSHDYLWRVHSAAPARRTIGVFNRSHYEDVLVVRVHGLVPEDTWRRRYDQINEFEKLLAENGVTILKFFLHISKEEQKERLQARLDDPSKHWKFAVNDLKERARWNDYMSAYEDMLNKTSTNWAPWYLVPANKKWYRDLVVSRVLTETLRGFDMKFPEPEVVLKDIVIPD